jgi:hypothetical protein
MLIKGLLLTLYILRWSLELLLIYIEVPVPNHQNISSWFGNCTVHTHEETYCYHKLKNNLHLKPSTNLYRIISTYNQQFCKSVLNIIFLQVILPETVTLEITNISSSFTLFNTTMYTITVPVIE